MTGSRGAVCLARARRPGPDTSPHLRACAHRNRGASRAVACRVGGAAGQYPARPLPPGKRSCPPTPTRRPLGTKSRGRRRAQLTPGVAPASPDRRRATPPPASNVGTCTTAWAWMASNLRPLACQAMGSRRFAANVQPGPGGLPRCSAIRYQRRSRAAWRHMHEEIPANRRLFHGRGWFRTTVLSRVKHGVREASSSRNACKSAQGIPSRRVRRSAGYGWIRPRPAQRTAQRRGRKRLGRVGFRSFIEELLRIVHDAIGATVPNRFGLERGRGRGGGAGPFTCRRRTAPRARSPRGGLEGCCPLRRRSAG